MSVEEFIPATALVAVWAWAFDPGMRRLLRMR